MKSAFYPIWVILQCAYLNAFLQAKENITFFKTIYKFSHKRGKKKHTFFD